MTTGELYCDSRDGSNPNMYSMIDLVGGEHRGRCNYPCNPDAQARWEAHRAHRAKSRATQKRLQQRLFRNDTTAKARFALFEQRMTPEKDRLRKAKKLASIRLKSKKATEIDW